MVPLRVLSQKLSSFLRSHTGWSQPTSPGLGVGIHPASLVASLTWLSLAQASGLLSRLQRQP